MKKENTLKENLEFLIKAYERELEEERKKDLMDQDEGKIEDYENIIYELKFAIKISKGE